MQMHPHRLLATALQHPAHSLQIFSIERRESYNNKMKEPDEQIDRQREFE